MATSSDILPTDSLVSSATAFISSMTSSAISSATDSALSSASSTTSSFATSTSSGPPSQTSDPGAGSGGDGGGRPLLFFVALGFGVVFTNLWIIVGVKYCFRYNQRNRQQIDQETGEPIDMANMPRPRRRREKKLMTMDDVNERFPLIKYKAWRASREQKGLPAAGGVTAPPSRAGSIKETMLERMSTEQDQPSFADTPHNPALAIAPESAPESDSRDFANSKKPEGEGKHMNEKQPLDEKHTTDVTPAPETSTNSAAPQDDDEDDDDPIRTAVPNELLQAPGDACAICIDNLDDDDEVRGLTCGHAFHAGCLDPWLTSRRACCPLCKADYYVPKQRPQNAAEGGAETDSAQAVNQNFIRAPPGMTRGRVVFAGSRFHVDHHERYGFPILVRDRIQPYHTDAQAQSGVNNPLHVRQQDQLGTNVSQEVTGTETAPEVQSPASRSGIVSRMTHSFRRIPTRLRPNHNTGTTAETESLTPEQATPGQLEAGNVVR